jgi:hypothetical protein
MQFKSTYGLDITADTPASTVLSKLFFALENLQLQG